MSRFPSLPHKIVLADVFKRFPDTVGPLFDYHDRLLRGPSPFSVAQRELLAAYVSGLNACQYCYGAHRVVAEIHGIPPDTLEQLLRDPGSADIDPRMLPVLAYVSKLTGTPSRMTDTDAEAVYAAGWSEEALFHAVSVCALFNFMNRFVEGCGIETDLATVTEQRERHTLLKDDKSPYQTFGRRLGIIP